MGLFSRILAAMEGAKQAGLDNDPRRPDIDSWYVPKDRAASSLLGPDGVPALHLLQYRDSGGEQVLRLVEDATGLMLSPTDRRLAGLGIYVSQLRGEGYHQNACRRGDFSPGARVELRREPDNPHDKNAVAVYDATGTHKAAYVNKQKAATMSRLLDRGDRLTAISIRGTGRGRPCEQIAVLAAADELVKRLVSAPPAGLPRPAFRR